MLQKAPIEKGADGGEKMQAQTIVVIAVIVILIIAAVKTVIPNAGASKPCLLGYKATCSFTPISTIILVAVAVIIFFVANQLIAGGLT
jgi:hypothetical protein